MKIGSNLNRFGMVICSAFLFLGLCGATPAISARADTTRAGVQPCTLNTSSIADCFPDPNLASAIAKVFNKITTDVFTSADSQISGSLSLRRNSIKNLEGIQKLTRVTDIDLAFNSISNITPLSSMTQLNKLNLNQNKLSDLAPLKNLINLTMLQLSQNRISDLTALEKMDSNLNYLDLRENEIQDAAPLGSLANIHTLDVSLNKISDASPFSRLTNMVRFEAYGNMITDPAPFANLNKLDTLNLRYNQIGDLTRLDGFRGMANLYIVDLTDQVVDLPSLLADKSKTVEVPTTVVDANTGVYAPITDLLTDGGTRREDRHAAVWPSRTAGYYTLVFSYMSALPVGASSTFTYSGWVQREVNPSVTVTFDSQGGSPVPSQLLAVNGVIGDAKPANPVKDGYLFVDWTTDKAGSDVFDFNTPVGADMTLYAQWRAKPTTPTTPTKPGGHGSGSTVPDPVRPSDYQQPLAQTGISWLPFVIVGICSVFVASILSMVKLGISHRDTYGTHLR